MGKDDGRRLADLMDKREHHEGTKVFQMLLNLATSQYAVNRNYQELSTALTSYEHNLEIWNVKNRAILNAFLRELSRLLHNYLSSTFSLIRHNVKLCKDLGCSVLDSEYLEKIDALDKNENFAFIKDLRTFAQHIGIPLLEAKFSFKRDEANRSQLKQNIMLDTETLSKWKKWQKASKDYIRNQKEIDLRIALDGYQSQVKTFYEWFYMRVGELYSRELKEFEEIDAEIGKLNRVIFEKEPSPQHTEHEKSWRCIWGCGFEHQDVVVMAKHEIIYCRKRKIPQPKRLPRSL